MLRSLTLAAATLMCSASLTLAAEPASAPPAKPATTVALGKKQLQDACMKAHSNDHTAFKECLKKPGEKKL